MINDQGISGATLSFAPVADHLHDPSATVLITRLSRRVYSQISDEQLGMKLKSFVTLNHLRENGPIGQQPLATRMCVDANMLVLILNDLEAQGFAERRRDPEDRRRHIVEATAAGLDALAAAEVQISSIEDELLGAMDPAERAQLGRLLERALESATRAAEADGDVTAAAAA